MFDGANFVHPVVPAYSMDGGGYRPAYAVRAHLVSRLAAERAARDEWLSAARFAPRFAMDRTGCVRIARTCHRQVLAILAALAFQDAYAP